MPTTLNSGLQLPDKGSVDWYSSMQTNYNLLDNHLENTDIHVTAEDKANWDGKQGSLSQSQLDAIAQVAINTNDIATLQTDKADTSHTHSSSDITDIDDYATKQYVDNSISGLVDNAPDALNTLNELSAALNDDSNFATTVTNALAAKADSADLAAVATSGFYNDLDNKPTIPSKISDLIDDSNFVDISNSAVASGITSAKVTSYDAHIADNDIHVTTADKSTWNTVTSKANDSDVVHKSGNETVSGQKTFDSNTYVYNSDNTANTPSHILKNSKVVIGSTTDIGSQNIAFRDSADTNLSILKTSCESVGNTSLEIRVYNKNSNNQTVSGGMLISQTPANTYITPTTDNVVLFGSTSRRWSKIYGTEYYYGSNNVEFSTKFVTTDTAQTISSAKNFTDNISAKKIISNVAQLQINARSSADSVAVIAGANASEGSGIWLYGKDNATGSDCRLQIYNTSKSRFERVDLVGFQFLPTPSGELDCGSTTNKWKSFNGLNPSSLSMPDLNNGIDISSYITHLDKVVNNYTPPSNGWLSIRVKKTSLAHASLMIYQTGGLLSSCETTEFGISGTNLPVIANQKVEIYIIADSLASAMFFPCQGNV